MKLKISNLMDVMLVLQAMYQSGLIACSGGTVNIGDVLNLSVVLMDITHLGDDEHTLLFLKKNLKK